MWIGSQCICDYIFRLQTLSLSLRQQVHFESLEASFLLAKEVLEHFVGLLLVSFVEDLGVQLDKGMRLRFVLDLEISFGSCGFVSRTGLLDLMGDLS